jgi:hypothetical protein
MQKIEDAGYAACADYLEGCVREFATDEPEVVHLIVPVPLDVERFPERRFGSASGIEINRILSEMARRSRRHAAWMVSHEAALTLYVGGMIVHRRRLRARRDGRSFSLPRTLRDFASTLHFAVDVFAASGAVPRQVGVQTALVNAQGWLLALPATFGGASTLVPRTPRALALYPEVPSLLGVRSFLEDAGEAAAALERALVSDYRWGGSEEAHP